MTRDEVKTILGEGATEEQVTNFLNYEHTKNKAIETKLATLNSELEKKSDYDDLKSKLTKVEQDKLTEQEKIELQKKEIEENLKKSRVIVNTAEAKNILAGLDIEDDLIQTLVSDDNETTVANATRLKNKLDSLKTLTIQETEAKLSNLDKKPDMTNKTQDSDIMTWDKFKKLSLDEQAKFQSENPEQFAKL